jgi:hypothetical protein
MRITAAQRTENENRIRTVMDRLLRGETPPLADATSRPSPSRPAWTAPPSTAPYSHLSEEFERRLQALQQAGHVTDPREAQIARLKAEVTALKERLARSAGTIDELTDFHTQALARLAAQHDEIIRLRGTADRMRRCAQDPDPAVRVFDRGEHVQAGPGQGDGLEEVARQERVGLGV